jgi:hypothetical protein
MLGSQGRRTHIPNEPIRGALGHATLFIPAGRSATVIRHRAYHALPYVTANGAGVEQSLEGPDGRENDAWLGYAKDTSATVNETFTVRAICAHVTYANPGPDLHEESPCTHAACALPLPPR